MCDCEVFGTYIFKSVLTKLGKEMKKPKQRKPCRPPHYFVNFLYIENTKNKNELVKNKVPKSVLNLLKKIVSKCTVSFFHK